MKKILFLLMLASPTYAGTGTFTFGSGGGTITISSGPASTTDIITFDAATSSGAYTDVATPLTWSHTIGSGADRFIAVGCGTSANDQISGITIAGSALTLSTSVVNGTNGRNYIWTYIAPPSGAQTISVSDTASHANRLNCGAVSFAGVSQSSPVDASTVTVNYPGAGTITATWNTVTANDALFDVVNDYNNGTLVPGSGQAQTSQRGNSAQFYTVATSTKQATTAGSYTMTWTGAGGSVVTSAAIAIKPGP